MKEINKNVLGIMCSVLYKYAYEILQRSAVSVFLFSCFACNFISFPFFSSLSIHFNIEDVNPV